MNLGSTWRRGTGSACEPTEREGRKGTYTLEGRVSVRLGLVDTISVSFLNNDKGRARVRIEKIGQHFA